MEIPIKSLETTIFFVRPYTNDHELTRSQIAAIFVASIKCFPNYSYPITENLASVYLSSYLSIFNEVSNSVKLSKVARYQKKVARCQIWHLAPILETLPFWF